MTEICEYIKMKKKVMPGKNIDLEAIKNKS